MCRFLGIKRFFKFGEKFRLRRYQRKTMPLDKNVQILASGVNLRDLKRLSTHNSEPRNISKNTALESTSLYKLLWTYFRFD